METTAMANVGAQAQADIILKVQSLTHEEMAEALEDA